MKQTLKEKRFILIINLIIFTLTVIADRLIKIYAESKLKNHPNKSIINGILEFTYLENSGAAFGLLKGQKSFFILVTIIILFAILYVVVRMPAKKHFYGAQICLSLIAAGSVANMIDRILYSYVVDYIYFSIIQFPIFNLADFFVTTATFVLIVLMLFFYKEDDLNFLRFMEKKIRNI